MSIIELDASCVGSGFRIALLHIDPLREQFEAARRVCFAGQFSPYRTEKILRFRFDKDQLLSYAAGVLLDRLLRSHYGLSESRMRYTEGPNGKPAFGNHPDIRFNLSHSGGYAACVMGERESGIDIEQILPSEEMEGIADRFFTRHEREQLLGAPAAERLECFYRLWTLKESYIKVTGEGLSRATDSFSVRLGDTPTLSTQDGEPLPECRFAEFSLPDYRLAVCVIG